MKIIKDKELGGGVWNGFLIDRGLLWQIYFQKGVQPKIKRQLLYSLIYLNGLGGIQTLDKQGKLFIYGLQGYGGERAYMVNSDNEGFCIIAAWTNLLYG